MSGRSPPSRRRGHIPTAFPRRGREQARGDRKSTRLNSSHTEIYTLSLHDALPISTTVIEVLDERTKSSISSSRTYPDSVPSAGSRTSSRRSEEHTSELQSHRDLHSFPTRRSSDLDDRDRSAR